MTADAGPGCRFANGRFCPPYASCRADDACNGCRCEELSDGSFALACTLIGCPGPRPTRPCMGGEAPGCRLPDGSWCRPGIACLLGDGCKSCMCDPRGEARCTELPCPDAGARDCTSSADCPSLHLCAASAPGCDAPMRCRFISTLFQPQTVCACDGRSAPAAVTPRGLLSPVRYRAVGPCPP